MVARPVVCRVRLLQLQLSFGQNKALLQLRLEVGVQTLRGTNEFFKVLTNGKLHELLVFLLVRLGLTRGLLL